jgi:hypothetical protein
VIASGAGGVAIFTIVVLGWLVIGLVVLLARVLGHHDRLRHRDEGDQ